MYTHKHQSKERNTTNLETGYPSRGDQHDLAKAF